MLMMMIVGSGDSGSSLIRHVKTLGTLRNT